MSPRAACRLAAFGFSEVYDYVAGKADWLARNEPVDGPASAVPTIGRYLRQEVVTALPDEPVGGVRLRIGRAADRSALVTIADGVLLGRLGENDLDADARRSVGEVVELGPSTLRPHLSAAEVRARLEDRGLPYAIVTDPDGHLLGTVHAAELP